MSKLKQLFLLRKQGSSIESISKSLRSSRNTVRKYLRMAEQKGLSVEVLSEKEDYELENVFAEPTQVTRGRYQSLEELFPWVEKELKRTGVTRWILWGEYKARYPDGYSYTQFCDYYKQWGETQKATIHIDHSPGDKVFIDFTGKKLTIVDRETGEIKEVEVYIALLGYSGLTYVEAVKSQKKEDFIKATENALHYFGGVPGALVTDNLKSAVIQADKYEPHLNESFLDFANHYGTAILPARSRKPKDKALVENAVNIAYSRIFAPLRDKVFFCIESLNEAIKELLEAHNNLPFQREGISRREKFKSQEASLLIPLAKTRYELKQYKTAQVMKFCHIQLEKHYYSVPYRYIGKTVKIVYTSSQVNIFHNHERIAFHPRAYKPFGYSTNSDHLSSTHQYPNDCNPQKFISWAERISPLVKSYIEKVLELKAHPEQAYRSCTGILLYEKKLGKERLIKAIERASYYQVYNYRAIKKILEGGLDMLYDQESKPEQTVIPFHENIRGKENYK